jgi:1-acyl-sn-glycerol-3-phosphate acyltransferase
LGAEVGGAKRTFGERAYRFAYGVLYVTCNALFRVYFRYRAYDSPRLQGPFVLVANHTSQLDPLLLGAGLRRRLCYMMTEVFYRSPRAHRLFRFFRAIPVALRGGNRDAIRAARAELARGAVVAIFPEGGLSRDGVPLLGNPGAVALVLSEGVPVVPAAIIGAHDAVGPHRAFPRPSRITVRYGRPLQPDELMGEAGASRKARLAAATERLMRAIAELGGQTAREDVLRELRVRDKNRKA